MHGEVAELCIHADPLQGYEDPMSNWLLVLTAVISLLSSCAQPQTPWPPGHELPGWYDVPEEPANVFAGEARLRLVNGGLQGELTFASGQARPMYFAMKWKGADPQPISAMLDPAVSASFSTPAFEPPLAVRVPSPASPACSTAEGRLLAYEVRQGGTTPDPALDELIGVAFKPQWLFPFQQSGYNEQLTWNSCLPGAGDLMPLQLQHDPRLKLALCDTASEPSLTVCGQAALDRTRVHAIDLSVDADGDVFLSPNLLVLDQEPVTFVVNGRSFAGTARQLRTTLTSAPWRAGRNKVEVRQGTQAPWVAEVVLPVHSLNPKLHGEVLREGAAFTASWDEAPWADGYALSSDPIDVPPARVAHPRWSTERTSVTETFPGFRDGNGAPVQPERARLTLRVYGVADSPAAFAVFHSSAGYVVEWSETLDVAVGP
jgi:hypothetical protein